MSDQLRYDNQVVVITGAGGGLGKIYATFFASRGASVVVNDLGGALKGEGGSSTKAADVVVNEIKAAGGKAVANYDSVEHGEKIIETAIKAFGHIDILINNAGILRDVSFKNMTDADWDLVIKVHTKGSYKCSKAAWPHFRKQKYGRVINTASAAGLFGNFGQSNYSAAKLALVGFTETLAKEGEKYNILSNVIAPVAASRMTESVMPPDILKHLGPEWIVPLVAVLVHKDSQENGSIFEVGAGHVAKLRWERANGLLLKADNTYTPGAILKQWEKVSDFSNPQYPSGPNDFMTLLEDSLRMGPNPQDDNPSFKDRVVLVTGGGAGIGRAYCLAFAKYGASVVVNDLVNPDDVVGEIKKMGGKAVGVKASAEDGDIVVKAAIDAFNRIDIVVNNAGILRDKAFTNLDESLWDPVMNVHLRGTYKVTKAAWPYFLKQKYGRVINTTSTSGIYGNFGQANYAAAKCGILGFSRAIALEGAKYNIYVNTIAPNAGTAMTATVMPEEMVQAFKPDYIAPLVLALASDKVPQNPTGGLYEVGSGWCGRTRWQRSGGHDFPVDAKLTPEQVAKQWERITNFDDGRADNPEKIQESVQTIMKNISNKNSQQPKQAVVKQNPKSADNEYLRAIQEAKNAEPQASNYKYEERDVILYNLGVGAKRTSLEYVYENHDSFHPLPTFFVLPSLDAGSSYSLADLVPNFSPMTLLHGEQFLELLVWPPPASASLVSHARLLEVLDKGPGNAAVVRQEVITKHATTGKPVARNESVVFLRGCGGFGGDARSTLGHRGASSAENKPPPPSATATAAAITTEGTTAGATSYQPRTPDVIVEQQTSPEQAALYRLSGDYNPLHIDPSFSRMGGFKEPILHGLCSFGFAGRALYENFGPFKNIKVRFAGTVVPGQTLVTDMWRVDQDGVKRVIFQTRVKETGKLAISNAAVELM